MQAQIQQLKSDNENIMGQMQNERSKLMKQLQQKDGQVKEEAAQVHRL
jgi:hypothetical protein